MTKQNNDDSRMVGCSSLKACGDISRKFTHNVVTYTETFYYKLGLIIGKKPVQTIVITWAVVFISALGLLRFRQEKNPMKLWVPPHTSFARDTEWLLNNLQTGYQDEVIMITGDDVLTPAVLQELFHLDEQVRKARSRRNYTLNDVCFQVCKKVGTMITWYNTYVWSKIKTTNQWFSTFNPSGPTKQMTWIPNLAIPKVNKGLFKLLEDNTTNLDPSLQMNPALYCGFVEAMKKECFTSSILELWDFNKKLIWNLTKDDIILAINTQDNNDIYGNLKRIDDLFGGVIRNESGHIIGAKALENIWYLNLNFSAIDMDKTGNMAGTAMGASEESNEWEGLFLNLMENFTKFSNLTIHYKAGRSFGDISNATMFQDMDKLCLGIFIMIIYVQLVISKFNWLEARIFLGFIGLFTIGMAFIVGIGLCSLMGVFYGPVHTSLPFLLMGLGIDDMFVILACWEDLAKEEKKLPLDEKIGLMLKHAGVSITITSFTDVIAFLIGSSTILPCLESFCIYAAVCVLMTFVFAVSFFTACFVLDQRRIEVRRNGTLPFIQHKEDYVPNECSQTNISNSMFNAVYSNIVLTTPGKIIVIAISITCAGFALQSALRLEQIFDPEWFIPTETHYGKFLAAKNMYYPDRGFDAGFYIGPVNFSYEINNIKTAVNRLQGLKNITENIQSWVDPFRQFVSINFHHDIFEEPLDDDRFNNFLSKFLMSPYNAKYQANFIFDGILECGVPAPKIKLSVIDFHLRKFRNPTDHIPGMHMVREIAKNANFTTGEKFSTVWSQFFSTWVTDELIEVEVMRNLQLALLCVMLCTILLIADWQICTWIFICVLITMVDVMGFMQRWGLNIDLVTCIGLELGIGLCVDYATHVGHTFLTVTRGTRRERSLKTVSSIGSAVLYGGLSTFIGVSMMSFSTALIFQSFFKIFLLVIVFGLFHGVVLLPVVLSTIGPSPYRITGTNPPEETNDTKTQKNGKLSKEDEELRSMVMVPISLDIDITQL